MQYKNMCIKVLCIHTYITLIYSYLLLLLQVHSSPFSRDFQGWGLQDPNPCGFQMDLDIESTREIWGREEESEVRGLVAWFSPCLRAGRLWPSVEGMYLSRRPILQALLLLGSQNWMLSSSPLDIEAVSTELLLPPGFCTILGWNCTHPFLIVLCAICFLLGS